MSLDFRVPVIAGAAEVSERWISADIASDPVAMMAEASRRADPGDLLDQVDSLDVVNLTSWRYRDTPAALCERLRIAPPRRYYGRIGGESPVRMLDEAAQRIAWGESEVALVCGAEAQYSVNKARAGGHVLPWPDLAPRPDEDGWWDGYLNPLAIDLQITKPAEIYPLFEHAAAAAWGQTPAQAIEESGSLWSRMTTVGAARSHSWSTRTLSIADIVQAAPDNRMIAWPYTKRMSANPSVNQGAALILTSLERATALGIAEDRLVFLWSGTSAIEPRDYLKRENYAVCPAQRAVLETLSERLVGHRFDFHELYSCFPIVPKQARRTLGLDLDEPITLAGGLSFFGAPLNNYMTHAAVAMVERLRGRTDGFGLLYAQGEFMTKHHGLILSSKPPSLVQFDCSRSAQDRASGGRKPPKVLPDFTGPATVETFTVVFGRDTKPDRAAVIAKTASGDRTMAAVPVTDRSAIDALISPDRSPVGRAGTISSGSTGQRSWQF
jgi:acetyl-CoA C-acetyltransferase